MIPRKTNISTAPSSFWAIAHGGGIHRSASALNPVGHWCTNAWMSFAPLTAAQSGSCEPPVMVRALRTASVGGINIAEQFFAPGTRRVSSRSSTVLPALTF